MLSKRHYRGIHLFCANHTSALKNYGESTYRGKRSINEWLYVSQKDPKIRILLEHYGGKL